MKRVIVVVVVLVVGLSVLIGWKIYAQNEAEQGPASGSGVVEGDGVDLSARLAARVARVAVEEGATVEEGAVILELDCDEPETGLAEARARLGAAQAQARAARFQADAAQRSSGAARASVGAVGAEIAALDAQRDVAAREAARVESMGEHAALSRRDQARTAATGLNARARAARSSRSASRRQAEAAVSQAAAALSQAAAAEESVAAVQALVRRAELAVAECQILAPRAGVVERIYYEPGELVMPGSVVARIVDPNLVRVTFYLPNADAERARVGMEARVVADALDGRTFAATVRRLGLEAEFTPRNIQTRTDRDRLVYPVELDIPNGEGLLRPGMPVTVTLPPSTGG